MQTVLPSRLSNVKKLVYLSTALLSFHYSFIVYINSSFLTHFASERIVNALFIMGAILNIFFFLYIPKVLRRRGNYRLTLFLIVFEMALVLGMAVFKSAFLIIPVFIIHQAIIPLIFFDLDMFLESATKNQTTGKIRGIYMTFVNVPVAIAPFIVGKLAINGNFNGVYFVSILFLIPLFLAIFFNLRKFRDASYETLDFKNTVKKVLSDKNLFFIFACGFLLQLFYAWMIIDTPRYLFLHMGFNWGEIGTMLAIALLAFIILEIPVGRIADKYLGEKEFMTAGFAVLGMSTVALSFIKTNEIITWTLFLFLTRVGASLVEITTESHFFKQVGRKDASLISFFRISKPASFIIAPIITLLVLYFVEYRYLFAAAGIIMLSGVFFSLKLKDTG